MAISKINCQGFQFIQQAKIPESNICNNWQNLSTVLNIHFNNANMEQNCQELPLGKRARITEAGKLLIVVSNVNMETVIEDLFHGNN